MTLSKTLTFIDHCATMITVIYCFVISYFQKYIKTFRNHFSDRVANKGFMRLNSQKVGASSVQLLPNCL